MFNLITFNLNTDFVHVLKQMYPCPRCPWSLFNKQEDIIRIYDHGLHQKYKPTFTLPTSTMPKFKCPLPDSEFKTEDLEAPIVAALITAHSLSYSRGNEATAKVEKVKRPTIFASGTSEEWAYFLSRWTDHVDATKIKGKDEVIQLLECRDDPLRKDLTRSAGGSWQPRPQRCACSH